MMSLVAGNSRGGFLSVWGDESELGDLLAFFRYVCGRADIDIKGKVFKTVYESEGFTLLTVDSVEHGTVEVFLKRNCVKGDGYHHYKEAFENEVETLALDNLVRTVKSRAKKMPRMGAKK